MINPALPRVCIPPGGYHISQQPACLVTLLGSCVAACMRDPLTKIAGMNHFLLPKGGRALPAAIRTRYGEWALPMLMDEMIQRGAHPNRIEVALFGGGNMMPGVLRCEVGDKNAEFAQKFVRESGLKLIHADLGGLHPRRISFDTQTGLFHVHRVEPHTQLPLINIASNKPSRP